MNKRRSDWISDSHESALGKICRELQELGATEHEKYRVLGSVWMHIDEVGEWLYHQYEPGTQEYAYELNFALKFSINITHQ
jgi:hypothetical protein